MKKRILFLMISVLFLKGKGFALFAFREAGAKGSALRALTSGSGDALGVHWNPASLCLGSNFEFTSFYSRLVSVTDLGYYGSAGSLRTGIGHFGLSYSQFGSIQYNERLVYLSYSGRVTSDFFVGVNLKGMFLRIEEMGSGAAFGTDLGMLVLVNPDFRVGFTAKNLNRPKISGEELPRGFAAGIAFQPFTNLWVLSDLSQNQSGPLSLKTGVEYQWVPQLVLRGGLQQNPGKFALGVGTKVGMITMDYAWLHNGFLGSSHEVSLGLKFGSPPVNKNSFRSRVARPKKINLLTATREELIGLKGVGPVTADKILELRETTGIGDFEDLLGIEGMKKSMFKVIREQCVISEPPGEAAPMGSEVSEGGLPKEIE